MPVPDWSCLGVFESGRPPSRADQFSGKKQTLLLPSQVMWGSDPTTHPYWWCQCSKNSTTQRKTTWSACSGTPMKPDRSSWRPCLCMQHWRLVLCGTVQSSCQENANGESYPLGIWFANYAANLAGNALVATLIEERENPKPEAYENTQQTHTHTHTPSRGIDVPRSRAIRRPRSLS